MIYLIKILLLILIVFFIKCYYISTIDYFKNNDHTGHLYEIKIKSKNITKYVDTRCLLYSNKANNITNISITDFLYNKLHNILY